MVSPQLVGWATQVFLLSHLGWEDVISMPSSQLLRYATMSSSSRLSQNGAAVDLNPSLYIHRQTVILDTSREW